MHCARLVLYGYHSNSNLTALMPPSPPPQIALWATSLQHAENCILYAVLSPAYHQFEIFLISGLHCIIQFTNHGTNSFWRVLVYFEDTGMAILTFTLSSLSGCGIRRPLTCDTIGPSCPATTIVSPSFSLPLTRTTSIVVPRPGRDFTCWKERNVREFKPSFLS